jgi:hypothetical protein
MADPQTPNTGISNPPNGGAVTDVALPDSNESTVSQASAPNQPAQQTPQAAPAASASSSAPQASQQPQTPGQSQPASTPAASGQTPDLSKPTPQQAAAQVQQQVKDAKVQKASTFHDIAETLSGGPRFTYTIDANGNTVKTKIPVSNAHLALAIAMEALSGAAAGVGQTGPGAVGKAATAGLKQGQDQTAQIQKGDQEAQQQAQGDFARKAQITETNMRLYANAVNLGRMSVEDQDNYIKSVAPVATKLQQELPGFLKEVVGYKGLSQYNVTENTALPYRRVARIGADGQQAVDKNGVPQWDMDYLILDPKFKVSGLFTPEIKKAFKEQGLPWADNPNIDNTPMNAYTALNLISRASQWNVAKGYVSNFFDTVDKATKEGSAPKNAVDMTTAGSLTAPPIKDKQISGLVDAASNKYASQVSDIVSPDNFRAIIHGIVNQEHGLHGEVSSKGAQGPMQLMPGTATALGVHNINDPAENVDAGTKYFTQLLKKYKSLPNALAAYNAGPGNVDKANGVPNIPETKGYVANISKMLGISSEDNAAQTPNRPDMAQFTQSNPTFPSAVEKFNASLAHTDGSYGAALKDMEAKGFTDDVKTMSAFFNSDGKDNIKAHDDYVNTQAEIRKSDIQTQAIEDRAANKTAQDSLAQKQVQDQLDSFQRAKMPDNALQLSPNDLIANLKGQGVTVPFQVISDAQKVARYELPLSVASNKLWFKDKNANQSALAALATQLNPEFNAGNYDKLKATEMPNGKAIRTVESAAAVSNHLNDLMDLSNSIKSGRTNYPLLNKLEGELQTHTGGSDYLRLQSLTGAINGEMGPVLAGGYAPHEAEINGLIKNMNANNADDQIQQLGKLYTEIMYGKVAPFDEEYNELSGSGDKHLTIPASFTRLAQRNGYDTPWEKKLPQQNQQLPGQRPNEIPQYLNGKLVGYTLPGKTGMRPVTPQQ